MRYLRDRMVRRVESHATPATTGDHSVFGYLDRLGRPDINATTILADARMIQLIQRGDQAFVQQESQRQFGLLSGCRHQAHQFVAIDVDRDDSLADHFPFGLSPPFFKCLPDDGFGTSGTACFHNSLPRTKSLPLILPY